MLFAVYLLGCAYWTAEPVASYSRPLPPGGVVGDVQRWHACGAEFDGIGAVVMDAQRESGAVGIVDATADHRVTLPWPGRGCGYVTGRPVTVGPIEILAPVKGWQTSGRAYVSGPWVLGCRGAVPELAVRNDLPPGPGYLGVWTDGDWKGWTAVSDGRATIVPPSAVLAVNADTAGSLQVKWVVDGQPLIASLSGEMLRAGIYALACK